MTAAEVSAGDVITAQVLDDSGLGGAVTIYGPSGGVFFAGSPYGGDQTYVTSSGDDGGGVPFEVAANNSTGTGTSSKSSSR